MCILGSLEPAPTNTAVHHYQNATLYGKDKHAHNCRHTQTTLQPSKVEAFSEICPRVYYGLIRLNSHTLTSLIVYRSVDKETINNKRCAKLINS